LFQAGWLISNKKFVFQRPERHKKIVSFDFNMKLKAESRIR
jgi:hypothetical protein